MSCKCAYLAFHHSQESFIYVPDLSVIVLCISLFTYPIRRHSIYWGKTTKVPPDTDQFKAYGWSSNEDRGKLWPSQVRTRLDLQQVFYGKHLVRGIWLFALSVISMDSLKLLMDWVDLGEIYSERLKWSLGIQDGSKMLHLVIFPLSSNHLLWGKPIYQPRSDIF